MDTPYIPQYFMRGGGGGDPWSNLSHQYGQELDQDQAAYRQAVNQPNTLFDKFRQAFIEAQQRQMQQQAMERQQMLAESLQQHRMNMDKAAEERAKTAEGRAKDQATLNFFAQIGKLSPEEQQAFDESGLAKKYGVTVPKTVEMEGQSLGGTKAPIVDTGTGSLRPGKVGGQDFSFLQAPLRPDDPSSIASEKTVYPGGHDWQKEQDRQDFAVTKQSDAMKALEAKIQNSIDLQTMKGNQASQQLQFKFDVGALGPKGGSSVNSSDPRLLATAKELAKQWKTTGVAPAGIARNKELLTLTAQALGDLISNGDEPTDLAGSKLTFKNKQDAVKYFTTGKGADAFRQQETILHHANSFLHLVDALDNGDIQLANRFANNLGIQLGNDKAQNVALGGHLLSEEVAKYIANGQTSQAEREQLQNLMPMFSSPTQARGAVGTLGQFVRGQRQSWTAQRDAAINGDVPFQSADTPEDRGKVKLGIENGQPKTQVNPANGKTYYLHSDGKYYLAPPQ